MAILGFVFFMGVLAVAMGSIVVTIRPRFDYIAALLSDAVAAPVPTSVAQRRRVRRLSPPSFRADLQLIRAAA